VERVLFESRSFLLLKKELKECEEVEAGCGCDVDIFLYSFETYFACLPHLLFLRAGRTVATVCLLMPGKCFLTVRVAAALSDIQFRFFFSILSEHLHGACKRRCSANAGQWPSTTSITGGAQAPYRERRHVHLHYSRNMPVNAARGLRIRPGGHQQLDGFDLDEMPGLSCLHKNQIHGLHSFDAH
jgi:hypothetical protein